jgi:hypothetical protein
VGETLVSTAAARGRPTRITRDVHPSTLRPLLEGSTGAYLAFNDGDTIEAAAVAFRFHEDRYYVGLPPELADGGVSAGTAVALLIDAGWYWYDLRAIRARGTLQQVEALPPDAAPALTWLAFAPRTVVAWHYATLREVEDDGSN